MSLSQNALLILAKKMQQLMSTLAEKLMNIEIPPNKYNDLTRKEWSTLYNLINDKIIVIKSTNKGSAVVFWNRDCYIKEADKDIYEVGNDCWTLISIIHKAIE